ncbi:bifunctional metallophosphatase/5'-nucleotidase [Fundicoccus culcitae]|uniref:Bifunctional metallophosphatase/5'-nucleotidase n=1 Tax=Fundicoccus culcitae TaxID=2969821 RepID=A0ABY5P4H6_9LACT|nr:bifunctional UDP-sugar hydrolase/5'-nucleotidase [Fundicoccus culcitae]UUX33654.1 bifunctional metallophosphatase/5'-nucleotidase [Fundicoccus culcitae]
MNPLLRLLVTGDLHAQYSKTRYHNTQTILNTAQAIETLRNKDSLPTITLDLGDFMQGSIFSTYSKDFLGDGGIFIKGMNAIGYDYQILGNHDFNEGANYYQKVFGQLNAKILAANILSKTTGEPAYGPPYDMIEVGGVKIGIIGLTTSIVPAWENPQNIAGLTFLDAFECLKKHMQSLRAQINILVVAYHGSLGDGSVEDIENQGLRMLNELEGIDILLTSHMHKNMNQFIGKSLVVQAGYGGEAVVEVLLNQDLTYSGQTYLTHIFAESERVRQDMEPEFSQVMQWKDAVVGELDLAMPYTDSFTSRLYGHPFLEMINQIQLYETQADFSATTLINDTFQTFTGPISNELLLEAFPFHNNIAKIALSGLDLKAALEHNFSYFHYQEGAIVAPNEREGERPSYLNYDIYSGLELGVDFSKAAGSRLMEVKDKRTQRAIVDDQVYTLALSQFRASGGRGYEAWFNVDRIQSISNASLLDLVRAFVKGDIKLDMASINQHYCQMAREP